MDTSTRCATIGEWLQGRGETLAVAESLTGGQVAAAFAAAPGSSEWFDGAAVTYTRDAKHTVLKVPEGPVVSEAAARAMATGVAALFGADHALALTGAGGPEPQDGQPPGTVWIAVAGPLGEEPRRLQLDGDPEEIVAAARDEVVAWLCDRLGSRR